MIPENFLEQWRTHAPWQTLTMVEQDLVISRALVCLYGESKIRESLAFRGGTALNKLFIHPPARYSEDIDLVQMVSEPIGKTIQLIRSALDSWLGAPKSKLTKRSAKLIYRYPSVGTTPSKLKIEINTTEHFHIKPLKTIEHSVASPWFDGDANVLTYEIDELMATKLRALYQRNKGRDLFDLWLVQKHKLVDFNNTISIFQDFCNRTESFITRAMFEQNISQKRASPDFRGDIKPLLSPTINWDFEEAYKVVNEKFVNNIPGAPWKGSLT